MVDGLLALAERHVPGSSAATSLAHAVPWSSTSPPSGRCTAGGFFAASALARAITSSSAARWATPEPASPVLAEKGPDAR